ncbi:MAG TPA: HAMP domain-containing sensor histidine kinase [Ferruginibacter sp.]|jgi:two-component system phosphate regulon sensor histidine kinase PhoR|nr:HAMP domain-containing sensor histidine kinase [Ferruginibacter sp.]
MSMVIRSRALRLVILISTLLVAIIITVQLVWLQKVYFFEAKQFNINISKSIRGLYEDMPLLQGPAVGVEKLIENPNNDVYLIKVDPDINMDTLLKNVSNELVDFGIFTDCKIALYDPLAQKYIAEKYIDLPDAYHVSNNHDIPVFERNYAYVVMYFPHRSQYIIQQMFFWIVTSGILLLVLICFGASIFYLYQQKFLNETQKDFVNNFTHEFKTPLSVIKIAADVLRQQNITQKPDKLKKYAAIITEQTIHLQQQVQRLLEIAFTEQRNLQLVKEKFDANDLVQNAINDLQPLIEEKNVVVHTSFIETEPVIYADKSHLFLVIINLIENAIKYAQKPVIDISTYRKDSYFYIAVKDNGIGISKEDQKKIFERFYRVTNGNLHQNKGFGLGLHFVKKIIDAHFGDIEVDSTLGEGSIFIIKIPKNYN